MRPIIIISLDGATWDLLEPLRAAGMLPHLNQLWQQSRTAPLRSTIPYVTSAAWPSFHTGLTPGRHGLTDFWSVRPGRYQTSVVNSHDLQAGTLWDYASRSGKTVGALNVPLTFPPKPVNGFVVGDFLTPGLDSDFTYPAALREELLVAVPGYRILTQHNGLALWGLERFVADLKDVVTARTDAARYLWARFKPDLFMVHYQTVDVAQHSLWHLLLPETETDPGRVALARSYFTHLDEQIGQLLSELPEDAIILTLSDHGFGPARGRLYLNQWLADHGYLALKGGRTLQRALGIAEDVARKLDVLQLRRRMVRFFGKSEAVKQRLTLDAFVAWEHSWAYALQGVVCGRIRLNLQGREPQGFLRPGPAAEALLEKLREELLTWTDPRSGERLIKAVYTPEELYGEAPARDRLPDLIVEATPGYQFEARLKKGLLVEGMPDWLTGNHRLDGILSLRAPGISLNLKGRTPAIEDLCPTLLTLLGITPPSGLSGQSLIDGVGEVSAAPAPEVEAPSASGYSEEEEALVEERLRSLGYL